MQRVLVTGSEGFVGKNLIRELSQKLECYSLDIKSNANDKHFTLDISDPSLGSLLMELKPNVIVHLAAQTDVRISMEAPVEDLNSNGFGTLNLLQAAAASNCKSFIYINSGGAIYSTQAKVPYTEDSPVRPESAYGVTKQLAEDYVRLFCEKSDISWKSLALSNVYGPIAQNKKGIFYHAWSAMNENRKFDIFGQNVTRDYVHVLDVVDAIELAITSNKTGRFNIGTSVETSNLKVFNMMKDKMKSNIEYEILEPRLGEVLRSALGIKKAKVDLNWEPRIDLQSGVDNILDGLH
jgi:UDP-glucose 4-epimerase